MSHATFVRFRMHGLGLAGLALAFVVAFSAGPALAQTRGSWNVDADGTWSVTSNWLNNTVPGGVSGTATFANDITATRTVTLDTSRSLGGFIFGDSGTSSAASWVISAVSGSTMTMSAGTGTNARITVNALGAGQTATISAFLGGNIANTPTIIKDGVGTLVLSATNPFTSKLAITAGTLQVSADRNLGAVPGSFATDQIQISDGATLRTSAAFTLAANRGITVSSGTGTLSVNGGVLTYGGRVAGSGNTLKVTGANALTLTTTAVGTDVNWDFASNGGVRTFFESANALGTGSVTVRNGVRLTSQSMTTGTLANAVTLDSGAGLTARSSGGAQTYTNVILPSAGTVIFNKDDEATAAVTITSGATLTGNLTVDTSRENAANAMGDVTLSGAFSGASGAIIKSGTGASGRLILGGANTYGGNTTINTGTLQLGNGGTVGSLSPSSVITGSAGATLAFNRSGTITSGVDFNSAIIGGVNLAQLGSGTVVLTANNTIGKTSITNGTLQISTATQLGSNPASFAADQLTISNGATLRTVAGSAITLPVNRGITIGSGGGKLDINGANLIVNGRFTGSGQTVTVTGSASLSLAASGSASNVNWDFAPNTGGRAFFAGDGLGTGTVLVRNGVRLVSQNSAPTNAQVTNAVTLEDGAGLSARSNGGAVEYTNVTLPSTGTLTFNSDDQATAALTIASGKVLTGTLTVNTSQSGVNAVGDVTLSGVFSGAGGITKVGTGTSGRLILAGANTYSGNTTISTGTLQLGSLGAIASSGTIAVASGATFDVSAVTSGFSLGAGQLLQGLGTVVGNVTALGTIAPGASPGTLTFTDNLSLASGSVLDYELSGTNMTVGSGVNDLSAVLGNLTLSGTLNVTEIGVGSFLLADVGDSWRLFNYTGTLTDNGLVLGSMPTLSGGNSFAIDTSTDNQVSLVVVPEPATIVTMAVGLGLLGVAGFRRRFRRAGR